MIRGRDATLGSLELISRRSMDGLDRRLILAGYQRAMWLGHVLSAKARTVNGMLLYDLHDADDTGHLAV